ncbi:PucR family transcriptional regulator [Streptomyces sp. NPDC059740]|uniref:PucR family transcriptional regulator n=1 Tax=Streptomyces sp. NPDC059740 TaxID=3346926 RepID=UPI003652346E
MDTVAMPLRVRDLLARPDLHLSVAHSGGPGGLERTVEAALVCDLERPGRWLEGGELLMTTGLSVPAGGADPALTGYVQDVVAGGAACLALGLGAGLPFREAPAALVEAAREAGLTLLTVPEEVPFVAVTKAVFQARARDEHENVRRAFTAQRRLTAAATDGGLRPMLREWAATTGMGAAVLDPLGRLLASDTSQAPPRAAQPLVRRVAAQGLRSSAAGTADGLRLEVQPLGARRLRGVLVLSGRPDAAARAVLPGLVSLLSLELERRHLLDEPERRRRGALLTELLAGDAPSPARAHEVLAEVGVTTDRVRVLVVDTGPADGGDHPADGPADGPPAGAVAVAARETAADLALALPGGLVRVVGDLVQAVAPHTVSAQDLLGVLARLAPRAPAGIGAPTPPEAARVSLRQATGLLAVSRATGAPVEARQSDASRLLLGLGGQDALSGYADAVLGPLDAADSGAELVETLAVWLDAGGSWDTASRRLGVHRHTVRNRVDKAMRLAGRHLDDADDRFDLWLATRVRHGSGAAGS